MSSDYSLCLFLFVQFIFCPHSNQNVKIIYLNYLHKDEFNKISHKYILSLIYALKIKFKFLFSKMAKLKMDK